MPQCCQDRGRLPRPDARELARPPALGAVGQEGRPTSRTFAVMATAGDGSDGGESVSIGFGTLTEGVFAGSPAATTVTLADGGEQRLVVNFGSSRGHTVQVREGARRLRLNVLLDSSPRRPVTIPLVVTHVGGATEADYAAIPESVTFAAGQTSAHYYVRALPDGRLAVNDDEVVWQCRCEHYSLLIKKHPSSLMGQRGGDPLQGIIEIHMGIQGSETHR